MIGEDIDVFSFVLLRVIFCFDTWNWILVLWKGREEGGGRKRERERERERKGGECARVNVPFLLH
jgi:hypothetical protein